MGKVPRYDRFMVLNKIGRDQVLRRYFTTEERWCWIAGVLGIAGDAPVRGWLQLSERCAADVTDIAEAAGVTEEIAQTTLDKARRFGLIDHDAELDCLWVPGWENFNPPRGDTTATERKRKQRAQAPQKGEMSRNVTEQCHRDSHGAKEVRKEVSKEQTSTANAVEDLSRPEIGSLCLLLADEVERNGSKRPVVSKAWRDACRLLIDRDGRSAEEVRRAIVWCQADEFWRANVLSMPTLRRQFDKMRLQADRQRLRAVPDEHPTSRRIRELEELKQRLAAEEEIA